MEPKTIKEMKKVSLFIALSSIIISLPSCTNNKEEILYKADKIIGCDTSNVTYSKSVTTILKNNCYSCHFGNAALGNIELNTYETTIIRVTDESLLGTIKHQNGYQAMPENAAKLSDCDIAQIEAWINDGAKNN